MAGVGEQPQSSQLQATQNIKTENESVDMQHESRYEMTAAHARAHARAHAHDHARAEEQPQSSQSLVMQSVKTENEAAVGEDNSTDDEADAEEQSQSETMHDGNGEENPPGDDENIKTENEPNIQEDGRRTEMAGAEKHPQFSQLATMQDEYEYEYEEEYTPGDDEYAFCCQHCRYVMMLFALLAPYACLISMDGMMSEMKYACP
jgi:hypothetical protein